MDINKKLDFILAKYGIIAETSYKGVMPTIRKLKYNLTDDRKVALYGVGIEAECLLAFVSEWIPCLKIDYCFDKAIRSYKYKEIVKKTVVSPIEAIKDMRVDCVILGSYVYRETLIDNLAKVGYQGEIIDLYPQLEGYIKDHFADYKMIYHTTQAYLQAGEDDFQHKILLQKLIKQHLLIKDFLKAFHYIGLYVQKQYHDYIRYQKLKEDIDFLLREIKECIKHREKRDIIINWLDALSYYDINKFPFLQKKIEESVFFKNTYTVTPWTTETTKTVLFGEYPIEGKLFLRDFFSKSNVKLLKKLEDGGYGFGYCGMPKMAKLFDKTIVAPVGIYDNKFSGSIQKQWDAISILCQSDTPMCILIHTLRETHEPFICGEGESFILFGSTKRDWDQEECHRQAESSGEYIQRQLEFYEKLYKENAVQIYMSDHGRIGNSPMDENKIHTLLLIRGKNIQSECVEGLFSLVRFPELIEKIIKKESDWIKLTKDYALIENLDAYSEVVVGDTLSGRLKREEMFQCRGIVTLTDKYFLYAYGGEYYFTGRESEENEIDNPTYEKRVSQLKELCGSEFIDIYQYDKFKYSRQLYSKTDIVFEPRKGY